MTIVRPFLSFAFSFFGFSPPIIVLVTIQLKSLSILWISTSIYTQSSLVGLKITAQVPLSLEIFSTSRLYLERCSINGTKYARVFPEPVSDFNTTFLCLIKLGIPFFQTFVSVVNPASARISCSLLFNFKSANVSISKTVAGAGSGTGAS